MENMLIKILVSLMLFINLHAVTIKADTKGLKQCFYIITENKNSKDISKDLELIKDRDIPVFIVINSDDNISKNVIDVIVKFQEDINLGVLLENNSEIEKSNFVKKEYNKKIKLSGICDIQNDKLIYIGEKKISFNLIDITNNPLEIIKNIDIKKENDKNYALVINGNDFNISTLLFTYNELEGLPLEVSNYILNLKKERLVNNIFIYIGDFTIVFFSISIVIFIIAIIIFRKWSVEKFLD